MQRFWILIVGIVAAISIGCADGKLEASAEDPDGFEENLSSAMTTSDVGEVESVIDTIDERLETGGHSLSGLRYQKAQLLYRLGKDNEALSTIRSYTGADQPVLEGTLLYRIGRETEATTLFRESISDLERPLFEGRIASDELAVAASGIVMLYVLAGEDSSRFFERVMDNGLLNEQQLEYARLVASLTRDEVVASMWPSRIQVQQ